jgi:hypothetical protein
MSMLAFDCVGIRHGAKQKRDAARGFVRFPGLRNGLHGARLQV